MSHPARNAEEFDELDHVGECEAGTLRTPNPEGSGMTEQTTVAPDLVAAIDEALERFGARDLVSGSEVVDFLLDLRLTVVNSSDRALARLLDEERQPTA
jgi:hypothetical protein